MATASRQTAVSVSVTPRIPPHRFMVPPPVVELTPRLRSLLRTTDLRAAGGLHSGQQPRCPVDMLAIVFSTTSVGLHDAGRSDQFPRDLQIARHAKRNPGKDRRAEGGALG